MKIELMGWFFEIAKRTKKREDEGHLKMNSMSDWFFWSQSIFLLDSGTFFFFIAILVRNSCLQKQIHPSSKSVCKPYYTSYSLN